jgi:hypothetical protein
LEILNAGIAEIAVVNELGALLLNESGVISTTTIAGGSNSATTIYSTTGRNNVPFRVIGFIESTQATAGTWATAPSNIAGLINATRVPVALNQGTQGYTLVAEQATTSGTSIDFTGIPAWVTKIWIMFNGVSTSGTSPIIVQTGPGGGVETSGYLGSALNITSVSTTAQLYTAGFGVEAGCAATNFRQGTALLTLENAAAFAWTFTSMVSLSDAAHVKIGTGIKPNATALSRVRITTANGSDTFDAGGISIAYE